MTEQTTRKPRERSQSLKQKCAILAIALSIASGEIVGSTVNAASDLRASVCRVSNEVQGSNNLGSGTLIDKTADGREGLVLTCAHLFREGTGSVIVRFEDGKAHRAKVIDMNRSADLAALAIANPGAEPAEVSLESSRSSKLHACGYGPTGVYRCAVGTIVGQAVAAGQMSLMIDDPVRSGDSGGGVFDEQGRLVAVIWGQSQGVTYASYGQPLRQFLDQVTGRRTSTASYCPGGVCPRRPSRPALAPRVAMPAVDPRWQEFQRQLDELRAQKQDRGDYLTRKDLPNLADYARRADVMRIESESSARHESILERLQSFDGRAAGRSVGKAAAGLLGLSGPTGWAIVVASSVGGWLLGRRMKRKLRGAGGRRRRRFRQSA